MKKTVIIILLTLLTYSIYSQTAADALRYSRINYGGTARFTGLSGAFGALGADFSTLATNPAGLGLYKGSEMTMSFAPHIGYTSSQYNGTTASDNRVNFGMGNFGMVFSINTAPGGSKSPVKNINFGFGFNRQNDFNNRQVISGINMENSMMQNYADILNFNQTPPEMVNNDYPFDIGLAYGTNLVYYDTLSNRYYADAAFGGVRQEKFINTYGSINEMDFAVAANIAEKAYIGLTVGVPTINYYENSVYIESRVRDTIPNFISLQYNYDLHTRGTGVNVKFGVIYRPFSWFRIGANVHTPTWYPSMSDQWSSAMQSNFTTTSWNAIQYSPMGYYDYKLRTPFRAMGSLAFIIGRYGLVSADYEYVNYSQARFNSAYDDYLTVNNEISSGFKSWGNIRAGTEWRIMDLRLRAGFAYLSNPYTSNLVNGETYQFSGGFGYRGKHFFTDFTYVWARSKAVSYLYDPAYVNPVYQTVYNHTFSTTVGVRF